MVGLPGDVSSSDSIGGPKRLFCAVQNRVLKKGSKLPGLDNGAR
jgi:hypothetical protein